MFVARRVPGDAIEYLQSGGCEIDQWEDELPPTQEELARRLAAADGALTMLTDRIDAAMLAAAARLQIVANMAVGYDNVDPAVAAAAGVWLTNTPGVLAETVADFTFALVLAAARRVVESERSARAGEWRTWSPTGFLGFDVHRATLGIIGMGEIGQAVARRAQGFAMRVLYQSRTRRPALERAGLAEWAPLEGLLRASDFVTLHAPLTPETHHLIGARELGLMKPTAVLVNTARGPMLDHDALVDALREHRLAGAALDVTEPEPLPAGHALFGFENVVVTPHIASASFATRGRMARMAAENIVAAFRGEEPPNAVNQPTGRRRGGAAS